MPRRMRKARTKSTTAARTDAAGMTSLGKYTFLMRFADPTRLCDDWPMPSEKSVHGSSPVNEKSG
jgi:hypothetical protein